MHSFYSCLSHRVLRSVKAHIAWCKLSHLTLFRCVVRWLEILKLRTKKSVKLPTVIFQCAHLSNSSTSIWTCLIIRFCDLSSCKQGKAICRMTQCARALSYCRDIWLSGIQNTLETARTRAAAFLNRLQTFWKCQANRALIGRFPVAYLCNNFLSSPEIYYRVPSFFGSPIWEVSHLSLLTVLRIFPCRADDSRFQFWSSMLSVYLCVSDIVGLR